MPTHGKGIVKALVSGALSAIADLGQAILDFVNNSIAAVLEKMLSTPVPPNKDGLYMNLGEHCATTDCGVWLDMWNYYQDTITPLAIVTLLLGWVMIVGISSITSSVFSRSKIKQMNKRAIFVTIILSLDLWWPAMASLSAFMNFITQSLVPNDYISGLTSALSSIGAAGIVVLLLGQVSLGTVMAVGTIYAARWMVLHVFYVIGPLLLTFWVFCAGPLDKLSSQSSKYLKKIPPLLFVPIPVAAMFAVVKPFLNAGGIMGMVYAVASLAIAGILPLKMNGGGISSFKRFGQKKVGGFAGSALKENTDYGSTDPDRNPYSLPGRTGSTNQEDDEEKEGSGSSSSSSSDATDESGEHGKDLNNPEEYDPDEVFDGSAPEDAPALGAASEDDVLDDEEERKEWLEENGYIEGEEEEDEGFFSRHRDDDGYFSTSRKVRGNGGGVNQTLNRAAMAANLGIAGARYARKMNSVDPADKVAPQESDPGEMGYVYGEPPEDETGEVTGHPEYGQGDGTPELEGEGSQPELEGETQSELDGKTQEPPESEAVGDARNTREWVKSKFSGSSPEEMDEEDTIPEDSGIPTRWRG